MKTVRLAVLFFLAVAFPARAAETSHELTVKWIYSDEGENATRMPHVAWTADDALLVLDERTPEAERTLQRVDARTGARRPAIDVAAALGSLAALLGGQERPKTLGWPDAFDGAGSHALYTYSGDLFLLDLAASRFERLTHTPQAESIARLSPDGRKVSFVRDHDLYVLNLASRAETRLTTDGSETVLNGALSWVYWEEVFDHDDVGYWWSPDSTAIAFLRSDESGVGETVFPDFRPVIPRLLRQRYPQAGTANPVVTLRIADLASGTVATMDRDEAPYEYILGVTWRPGSRDVAVQTTNRAQTALDLNLVDRASGAPRRILSDPDPAWVDQHEITFLDGGRRFVWSSERDGYTHLYLYEADGTPVTKLTRGEWSVRGPESFTSEALGSAFVDERQGVVYFTALETSVLQRQLYRVRLDGSGFARVTGENGVHRVDFSPDRRFFADTFSAHCTPPSLVVRDASGKVTATLATSRPDLKVALDWQCPQLLTVPADDGAPLQVRLITPKGFDPTRKYPAIVYIYGGPSAPVVKDSWDYSFANNAPFDQILARDGYVVFNVDPRSATAASKTIEDTVLRDVWGDHELADFLAGVRWLKARPWVDPGRVGVWGWSGGGTSTVLLMTRSTEFKAGIAVAPNLDWRYYDTKFTETYMKTPADNPEGYARTSLIPRAKDLHGRLLLVHGSGDDNVHPQQTWAMVEALIEAGKPFDLMIYPMRKHTIDDRPARIDLFNRMLGFWRRNL
jgi:dipeptidyl-peptidase-4